MDGDRSQQCPVCPAPGPAQHAGSTLILAPGQILDEHARLARRLLEPTLYIVDFLRRYMASAWRADGDRAAGMFYPVVAPGTRVVEDGHAASMSLVLGRDLRDADMTYEVTPEMVHVMKALSENAPAVMSIAQAELPCAAGFAWLDETWVLRAGNGQATEVRAMSWSYLDAMTRGTEEHDFGTPREWPCCRIALWAATDDDARQGYYDLDTASQVTHEIGRLSLVHVATVPFELPFRKPAGLAPEQSVDSFLTLVHHLWMLLGMEIITTAKAQVPRHFRRRALRTIANDEVRVIVLRKLRHPSGEAAEERHVDWTCQWPVQGHWRHIDPPEAAPHHAVAVGDQEQKHCAQCDGRLTWVRPYCKGPDGLPLKASRTLMKLAR